jgi:hypothetical protein
MLTLKPAALMLLPVLGVVLPLLAVADLVEERVQARRALRETPPAMVQCRELLRREE